MTSDPILMEAVINSPGLLAAVVGPDGRVIQVNLTLCELLSTTSEKLTGAPAAGTVVGGDKLPRVLEVIPQGPWQPSVLQIETTVKSPRTGEHLIAYTISPRITKNYGAVAILVGYDVTDRARITEALRNSEAQVRAILDTAVDAIITINEHGVIESFNPAAERIFGYNSAEVIGHKVEMLMPEPYHSEHQGYIENYKKTGHAKIIGIGREVTGQKKDGTTFPMYLAVGQQLIAGRRHFTGIVRDLTNVKQLEIQLLQMSDNIHRKIGQDLHDGLGQLLTGTALQSKALSEHLKKKHPPLAGQAEQLASLINEGISMSRELARGLQPLEDPMDLPDAMQDLAIQAEKLFNIECLIRVDPLPPGVDVAAATHLYRIAQEAVNNAARHGKAKHAQINLQVVDADIRMIIRDDGVGFPAQRGRGLGLHTMDYRSRALGGKLEIRSTPGEGTTVICTVYLQQGVPEKASVEKK